MVAYEVGLGERYLAICSIILILHSMTHSRSLRSKDEYSSLCLPGNNSLVRRGNQLGKESLIFTHKLVDLEKLKCHVE